MEIVVKEVTRDTKFVYSVKPKLTAEEISRVRFMAIFVRKVGIGNWIAEAIRQKLKEEQSARE